MKFIDAHCHLYAEEFNQDRDEVFKQAFNVGLKGIILVAEKHQDYPKIVELCEEYPGLCFAGLGLHPVQDDARSVTEKELAEALPVIEQYIEQYEEHVCCIGEVGLDHTPHVCSSAEDKRQQELVLRTQVELSAKYNLPLNVHSRSAAKETVRVLSEAGAPRALLHNFAGRPSVAQQAVACGFYLSFPPCIINKPEVRNIPANIRMSCEHIAKIKNISPEEVATATWTNTLQLFPKLQRHLT